VIHNTSGADVSIWHIYIVSYVIPVDRCRIKIEEERSMRISQRRIQERQALRQHTDAEKRQVSHCSCSAAALLSDRQKIYNVIVLYSCMILTNSINKKCLTRTGENSRSHHSKST
jgi:hypothetical protein